MKRLDVAPDGGGANPIRSLAEIRDEMERRHGIKMSRQRVAQILEHAEKKIADRLEHMIEQECAA